MLILGTTTGQGCMAEFNNGEWEVNSGQRARVGNFVFALFCSGNSGTVGYKCGAGEKWELKSEWG